MPPITVMIKPASGLCNLRCSYCFYKDEMAHRAVAERGIMTKETARALIRRAFAYSDGQISFAFQGGEPLLAGKEFYRDFLREVKSYSSSKCAVGNSIQTNGTLIDHEWCEIFKEGNFLVGVSLDGTEETHDMHRLSEKNGPTQARVLAGIQQLKDAGIEYNILCVVTKQIAERPQEVFNALKTHRWLQFIPCLNGFDNQNEEWSLTPETYGAFLIETFDLYEKAWNSGEPVSIRQFDNWMGMLLGHPPETCSMSGVCGEYFLAESDGDIYPCDFYAIDEWHMGNIKESSFFRLEKSEKRKAFREESLPVPKRCKACEWYFLCRNGCRRDRVLNANGELITDLCSAYQLFFNERADRMQNLARSIKAQQSSQESALLSHR